jgi:hypothetical protein
MSATQAPIAQNLEQPLLEVEGSLNRLGEALLRRDMAAIELHAASLHGALAQAVAAFREAASTGSLPAQLRNRLVLAGGRMAAQRESLSRASVALDRAIDVLMPADLGDVYGASGKAERRSRTRGSLLA